ncbi:hypothetical protein ONZ43_g6779 [Nemania bipapillata]|uniref:Uncharacterized protein n=1 Tax=Nemania bipapillata TaxID=110536 RepID=A0ACC2HW50_9PEZI|nr:hypothetical protein ONZ43_g6779 [Nemania bipapillata]
MAVLEIALPKLKKDAAKIAEAEETILPSFRVKLQEAGVLNGLRGFFVTENGQDIRQDFREVLLLEWPHIQKFKDFIVSPAYLGFAGQVKDIAYGPPELKLFDVSDDISSIFGSETTLEYLVVKPKDTSEASVKSLLQKLQSNLPQFGAAKAAAASSLNLETQEIAVVGLYTSDAEFETAKVSASRQKLLADIANAADVTSLVAHVAKEIPVV